MYSYELLFFFINYSKIKMFRRFKIFAALLLVITLLGCSSITVSMDYDPSADFSKYKTYKWSSTEDSTDILLKNKLVLNRTYRAIDKTLKSQGFTKVESNPDFIVYPHAGTKEKVKVNTWDYGYSGWWSAGQPYDYIDDSVTNITYYTENTLFIDIVDAANDQLIWRGVGIGFDDSSSSPEESVKKNDEAVAKILKNYPPQKKNDKINGGLL
ncbi:MAG: DUF4136 domain-containing protein [Chlorobi bacterium]|nr:DUF4136 domain-containing protein [Chlorobiota bacterium]